MEFDYIKDMLKGNIARICVSDSESEILEMAEWAKNRIDIMVDIRLEKLRGE